MNPGQPPTIAAILARADALAAAGRALDAIDLLRPLATGAGAPAPAIIKLCYLLAGAGRGEEAVSLIERWAGAADADLPLLSAHGFALKATGRLEAAIAVYERATRAAPTSGVAEHNLAASLGDGHWFAEAEAATSRALGKGLDTPETWLVRARALQGLGRFDDAARSLWQVLQRRPNDPAAHTELAQLIWLRSEDAAAATETLDTARASAPADAGLARVKARFLDSIGDREGAYTVLADTLSRASADPRLHVDAALAACWVDAERALAHAGRAAALRPGAPDALSALSQANLAAGRPEQALAAAEAIRRQTPHDQFAVALTGTAWRLLGDPRYAELYDYDRLVLSQPIDTPDGWLSLEAYLDDLDRSVRRLHRMGGHPIGQSLRRGTQTAQSLDRIDDPAIRAFLVAIDGPIRRYLTVLERGGEVLGRPHASSAGYRFDKVWSSRLNPQGFHVNHLHPKGWVSSACHIGLPSALECGREGWLAFGEPGIPTAPALPAEYFVRPRRGWLVLFPSYMWHGTIPFGGREDRLTIAFDVIPP